MKNQDPSPRPTPQQTRTDLNVGEHVVVERQLLEFLESRRVPATAHHLDAVGHELRRPSVHGRKGTREQNTMYL